MLLLKNFEAACLFKKSSILYLTNIKIIQELETRTGDRAESYHYHEIELRAYIAV